MDTKDESKEREREKKEIESKLEEKSVRASSKIKKQKEGDRRSNASLWREECSGGHVPDFAAVACPVSNSERLKTPLLCKIDFITQRRSAALRMQGEEF